MDNDKWKEKIGEFINTCQDELRKTTKIGKKMLSASKTNTEFHQALEALGRYAWQQIRREKLAWNDDEAKRLVAQIEDCERSLEQLEESVQGIKSPEKVGEKHQEKIG